MLRRSFDILAASALLILCAPVFLLIAAVSRVTQPGSVLFRQVRLGLGGRRFRLLKFRTMKPDAEQRLRTEPGLYRLYRENGFRIPDELDPRILPFGRILRRTSLDELPQLINVLRGDMTLVGPRPIVPQELVQFRPHEQRLLAVRPGMTGCWQTSGRHRIGYPWRAEMELEYLRSRDWIGDCAILLKTLPAVFVAAINPVRVFSARENAWEVPRSGPSGTPPSRRSRVSAS